MNILDKKLKPESFSGKNVKALPNNPNQSGITAEQLKAAFDRGGEEVIATALNAVIDILVSSEGAANIGVVGGSVQTELDKANRNISQKADADNVLTKDNTMPYSPTTAYNPATKLFVEQSMSASGQGTAIVIIPQNTDIPIPDRTPNTIYLKITDTQSSGGGLPQSIKVSPNMGIKINTSAAKIQSQSGISFE